MAKTAKDDQSAHSIFFGKKKNAHCNAVVWLGHMHQQSLYRLELSLEYESKKNI